MDEQERLNTEAGEYEPLPRPDETDAVQDASVEPLETPSATILNFPAFGPSSDDDQTEEEDEIVDYTVEYGGVTYTIEEPDTATILRYLNFVGHLATKSERYKSANFQSALKNVTEGSNERLYAELFSLASTLVIGDIINLAAITFYGGNQSKEAEGVKHFRQLNERDPKALRIAPLIKGVSYRLEQSEDLREALGNLRLVRRAFRKLR